MAFLLEIELLIVLFCFGQSASKAPFTSFLILASTFCSRVTQATSSFKAFVLQSTNFDRGLNGDFHDHILEAIQFINVAVAKRRRPKHWLIQNNGGWWEGWGGV